MKTIEDHGRHPISQIYTIIPEYNTHRTAKVRVGAEIRKPEGNTSTGDEFRNKRRTGDEYDTNGVAEQIPNETHGTGTSTADRNVISDQF